MGLTVFRLALAAGWVVVVTLAVAAIQKLGALNAVDVFFGDLAHPWRAQFNIDFGLHLLLVGAWAAWRARTPALGLLWALLALCTGGAFSFAYILVVSIQVRGDMRKLLLGRHA